MMKPLALLATRESDVIARRWMTTDEECSKLRVCNMGRYVTAAHLHYLSTLGGLDWNMSIMETNGMSFGKTGGI
jgi:hypothetical protein